MNPTHTTTYDEPRRVPGEPGRPWLVVRREWVNGFNYVSVNIWLQEKPDADYMARLRNEPEMIETKG